MIIYLYIYLPTPCTDNWSHKKTHTHTHIIIHCQSLNRLSCFSGYTIYDFEKKKKFKITQNNFDVVD